MSLRNSLAFAGAALSLAATVAFAQQTTFATLSPPQPTDGNGKIEVTEFFWYGCPHCYALEPAVNAWLKNAPKDVVFKRVPAVPSDAWGELAKLYYTLEAMNLLDTYHQKVFDAEHRDKVNLANKKLREEWLAKNGIDVAKYNEAEKSFTVATRMQRAKQLTYAYKVDSVPRIFVNGKYYTSAEQAGSGQIFTVVDQLIGMARKEKGASAGSGAPIAQK
jgi:protein dithiol oxidoreductase (disulfide-forming)